MRPRKTEALRALLGHIASSFLCILQTPIGISWVQDSMMENKTQAFLSRYHIFLVQYGMLKE